MRAKERHKLIFYQNLEITYKIVGVFTRKWLPFQQSGNIIRKKRGIIKMGYTKAPGFKMRRLTYFSRVQPLDELK